MKLIYRLLLCVAIALMFCGINVFAADGFRIPSAGAETVLRELPTTYVYNTDWQQNTLTKDTEAGAQSGETGKTQTGDESADNEQADEPDTPEETPAEQEPTQESAEPEPEAPAQTAPVATNNRVVCIDAGHQSKGNNAKEPIGPGASETKAKVAGGTRGVATGVPEYQLTLDVALKLQSELQSRGYTVVMCRTTNDVNISNAERAEIANNAGAGAFLRLHGNGAGSGDVSGAETLAPSSSNPYCSGIASQSQALSKAVLNGLCAATGAKNRGVKIADNMSGINWSRVPVTIVEMGYMTNPAEDASMQDPAYQVKLAKGMADGVDAYFGL